MNFCFLDYQICGNFLRQPWDTNTISILKSVLCGKLQHSLVVPIILSFPLPFLIYPLLTRSSLTTPDIGRP